MLPSPTPRCEVMSRVCARSLRGGADVSAAQGDGMTALHWAALNGDLKTMDVAAVRRRRDGAIDTRGCVHAASSRQLPGSRRGSDAPPRCGRQAGAIRRTRQQARSRSIWRHKPATPRRSPRCWIAAPTSTAATGRMAGRRLSSQPRRARLDLAKVLLARGADTRIATMVIDYKAALCHGHPRRGRPATASFRRCSDARSIRDTSIDEPPPGAAAGQGGGPPAGAHRLLRAPRFRAGEAEAVRDHRRTSITSANKADSRRCITRRARGSPTWRARSSTQV